MKPVLKKIVVTYITPFKTKSVEYLFPFKTKSIDNADDLSRFFEFISLSEQQLINTGKLLADTYSVTDDVGKSYQTIKTETAIIGDEFHIKVDFSRLFTDNTNPTTDQIQSKNFGKGLLDDIFFTEVFDRLVQYNRRFTDNYTTTDVVNKNINKSIADAYSSTDYIEFRNSFNRTVTDQIDSIADSIQKKEFNKGLIDYPTITDDFNRLVNYVRSNLDSIQPNDDARKSISKLITDTINLLDTISISSADQEYEQIQATDQQLKGFSTSKSDFYSVADAIATIGISKIVNESISTIEQFSKIITFIRNLEDSVNMTESIGKSINRGTTSDAQYYQNEDGILSKDTYIDAQYFQTNYVDTVNVYFKTINESNDQIIVNDVLVVVPNKGFLESVLASDLDKSYIINTYIDSSFLSSNYIGSQVTI